MSLTGVESNADSSFDIRHSSFDKGLAIGLLPDHPTPCEHRTHTADPIPFCIYYPGIEPDSVQTFDEDAARDGAYGLLEGDEFIEEFMRTLPPPSL